MIQDRLNQRFIDPSLENNNKHGFAMMAIACLTIEAFQAIKTGHTNDKAGIGKDGFKSFFRDHKEFCLTTDKESEDFYLYIRCGLLHDAETRNGWRILRSGPLFDKSRKTINATRFLRQLIGSVHEYFDSIRKKNWDGAEWKNIIKKLDSVVDKSK